MNYKKCKMCDIEQNHLNFHKKCDTKDGLANNCKKCASLKKKLRYPDSKVKIIEHTKNRRNFLRKEVNLLKNIPCKDCGNIYEPVCMEFDHLTNKFLSISKMIHESFSLKIIKVEISKCELVCILCHRERTNSRLVQREKSKIRIRNSLFVLEAKRDKPCTICGKIYNPWQMEFDHISPSNKRYDVSTMELTNYSLKAIGQEINKCRILCCLCHRRHTAKNWKDND